MSYNTIKYRISEPLKLGFKIRWSTVATLHQQTPDTRLESPKSNLTCFLSSSSFVQTNFLFGLLKVGWSQHSRLLPPSLFPSPSKILEDTLKILGCGWQISRQFRCQIPLRTACFHPHDLCKIDIKYMGSQIMSIYWRLHAMWSNARLIRLQISMTLIEDMLT